MGGPTQVQDVWLLDVGDVDSDGLVKGVGTVVVVERCLYGSFLPRLDRFAGPVDIRTSAGCYHAEQEDGFRAVIREREGAGHRPLIGVDVTKVVDTLVQRDGTFVLGKGNRRREEKDGNCGKYGNSSFHDAKVITKIFPII